MTMLSFPYEKLNFLQKSQGDRSVRFVRFVRFRIGKHALVLIWQKKCSEYPKSDLCHEGFEDAFGIELRRKKEEPVREFDLFDLP